jgi:hypothetical protein
MLSPHEFATLMLVRQAPDQVEMNRAELDALLERQLVMLEMNQAGARRVHLTAKGRSMLDALGRSAMLSRQPDGRDGRGVSPLAPGSTMLGRHGTANGGDASVWSPG